MLLLHDEADVSGIGLLAERIRQQPLLEAMRATIHEVAPLLNSAALDAARRRLNLLDGNPELRAALADYTQTFATELGSILAASRDVDDDDLAAQIEAHCVVTAIIVAVERWHRHDAPLIDEIERALAILESTFSVPATLPPESSG